MRIPEGLTLVDAAIRASGSVEALFDLATLNGIGITDELTAGQLLRVEQGREYAPPAPIRQVRRQDLPVTRTLISDGQNLVDVALQELGAVEGLFQLAGLNGLGITADLFPGQVLRLDPARIQGRQLVSWYRRREIRVNTGSAYEPPVQALPSGVFWIDYDGAIVADFDLALILAE